MIDHGEWGEPGRIWWAVWYPTIGWDGSEPYSMIWWDSHAVGPPSGCPGTGCCCEQLCRCNSFGLKALYDWLFIFVSCRIYASISIAMNTSVTERRVRRWREGRRPGQVRRSTEYPSKTLFNGSNRRVSGDLRCKNGRARLASGQFAIGLGQRCASCPRNATRGRPRDRCLTGRDF